MGLGGLALVGVGAGMMAAASGGVRTVDPMNIFDSHPEDLASEVTEDLVRAQTVRIERIVSKGHSSPDSGWYDQAENEWVLVVKGRARLTYADGSTCELAAGDYLNIPAHTKHRVTWTDPEETTVWLAVFY